MLTKRRKAPCSSTTRALMPGKLDSRESMTAARVAPSASTWDWSWVYVRRIVGMRTETVMAGAPWSGVGSGDAGGDERIVRGIDGGCGSNATGDRVEGLESVAGVEHDSLGVRVELAVLEQLLERRDGDAAGRLGEDALGAGEQGDALADLVLAAVLERAAGASGDVEHVRAVGRADDR